jgi:diaminopimelate decarboxylase
MSGSPLFALSDRGARALAEERGTPCFAYRLDLARERFASLSGLVAASLGSRGILAYAVKANPGAPLVAAFARQGAWLDCASIGELQLARSTGVPGSRLLLAGPGKSESEIALALELGARIEADGIEDLERIEAALASRPWAAELRVSLRVHPLSGVSESSPIIGGAGPSAFGVDEEDLPAFLREARLFRSLRIAGLQVFAASNELEAGRLLGNYRTSFAIAERMSRDFGLELDLVDLGGGLGLPYSELERELDVAALLSGLGSLVAANEWYSGRVLLEPGRWLAGPCGVYLARVLRAKASRGELFAVLEGGANHLLRPALTGQAFPARALRDRDFAGDAPVEQTLAGPLCTSLDRLGKAMLPPLRAGDLVMLGQAGAYGATEAMTAFLSHPPAPEYWLESDPVIYQETQ